MVYLSIYFCLQSLSSVFYSCPCTDLSPPWLNVFLDILLFLKQFPLLLISNNLTLMYMSALFSSILFRRYWAYFSLSLETFWKSYLHIIFVSQLPSHLLLGLQLLNGGPLLDIVPQVTEVFLSFFTQCCNFNSIYWSVFKLPDLFFFNVQTSVKPT